MKTNRAVRGLLAVLSAMLLGLSCAGYCAAGGSKDFPGVAKGDTFLAAGPLPVTLTFVVKKVGSTQNSYENRKAELLLLTEQFAIYRLKEKDTTGRIEKVPAASTTSTKIAQISAADPGRKKSWQWEFDPTTKRFSGPVREPEKIELKSPNFTTEQTNQFLFFTYQWMVDQLEDTVKFDDRELAKALIKKANRTADAIDQLGLDTNVARLFRNMKLHYDDVNGLRQDLEKTFASAANANLQLRQIRGMIETERRWIANTQASVIGLNFLSLVLGGEGSLAPDPSITRYGLANLHMKLQTDIIEKQLQQNFRDKLQESIKQYHVKIEARKERDKVVCKKIGLPYADWYAERSGDAAAKNDWSRLAERLSEFQEDYKKITPHGDPWLQLEIHRMQSLVNYTRLDNDKLLAEKVQKNAADRYKLALQMFDIVAQTPADKNFTEFRGDLIFKVAESAVLAAELELGDNATLRGVYNTKAIHALRLLNLAKECNVEDVNRNVSDVKFRAMAMAHMQKEALDFGSQFAGSRDTAKFHLTMAKLHLIYATDKKLDASKEYTKKAIKAGFYDFQALQTNADLKKVLSPDFIYENMAADVSVRIESENRKIKGFVLTNNSPFAIFNGSFTVGKITGYYTSPYRYKGAIMRFPVISNTNLQKIEFLRPNASMFIADSSNVNNAFFSQQNPLYGFTVTNQGAPGFPVKVKLDR